MAGKTERCETCVYRAEPGAANRCDYLIITGHSRGCPPGEGCTVFQPGERLGGPIPPTVKKREEAAEMPKGKRVEIDSDRALKLVAEGLTNHQIAKRLGVNIHTWRAYKARNGWTAPAKKAGGPGQETPPTEQGEAPEPTEPPEEEAAPPPPVPAEDGGPIRLSVRKSGYALAVEAEDLDALAAAEADFTAMLNAWI